MDLTSVLLRAAARRPHVLVVAAAGGTAARVAIEASIARRGWPTAISPADADLVVVAGSPGPDLAGVIERIWRLTPAPRARAAVAEPSDADRELDKAAVVLADRHHQRAQAPGGAEHADSAAHESHGGAVHESDGVHGVHGAPGEPGAGAEQAEEEAYTQRGLRHLGAAGAAGAAGGSEHPGHGGHHGHHGHGGGMELPGGLPMADLGEDRDGLALDRLHVPLGPVLPDWPAGLVVHVTLQGDVIQEAAAELLDSVRAESSWWTGHGAARELDALARFLGVTGWADAAAQARRLRDADLAGGALDPSATAALVRRVRRSRTLRWLVRGIPAGATDVAGLLEQRLTAIELAAGKAVPRPGVDELALLLVGAELGAARAIVAAVDPDTEQASVREGAQHG